MDDCLRRGMGTPGVLCKVCGDRASGKHYGVPSCDGCRGFFKRSIRRNLDYACKEGGKCVVDVSRRNQCQACRFAKCLQVNMRREAVQHERSPRNCTATQSLIHPNPFTPEMYPMSEMPLPHPSLFLPFAPLPSLCFSGYDFNRFASPYATSSSSSLWEPFNLSYSSAMLHNSAIQIDAEPKMPISKRDEEVEVTSTEGSDKTKLQFSSNFELLPESATKLLVLALKWIKTVPSFIHLPPSDQKLLLDESWAELFAITAAQWGLPIDSSKDPRFKKLQTALYNFHRLRIDQKETTCLKALILFKPEIQGLISYQQCVLLQEQTLAMLHKNCIGSIRFGHLLLMLLQFKDAASGEFLQETLFRKTLGEHGVAHVLSDILKEV